MDLGSADFSWVEPPPRPFCHFPSRPAARTGRVVGKITELQRNGELAVQILYLEQSLLEFFDAIAKRVLQIDHPNAHMNARAQFVFC